MIRRHRAPGLFDLFEHLSGIFRDTSVDIGFDHEEISICIVNNCFKIVYERAFGTFATITKYKVNGTISESADYNDTVATVMQIFREETTKLLSLGAKIELHPHR